MNRFFDFMAIHMFVISTDVSSFFMLIYQV